MIRIIDNKKVDMSDTEFQMYEQICRAYDRANFKGEDLFKDLIETDGDGIIIYIKPPTKNYSCMEAFLFLISLMNNQHLRINRETVQTFIKEAKENIENFIKEKK